MPPSVDPRESSASSATGRAPGSAPPPRDSLLHDDAGPPKDEDAKLVDLIGSERERAVPTLKDGFVGIYRWHAKRTLRSATWVRAVLLGNEVAAVSVLERLDPEVGYVYYLSTAVRHRRRGFGARLLDDALDLFRREGVRVVYGAAEEDNTPSIALFRSRGFRAVERKELGFREGGLGAWGLRSRMTLVGGEVLLGLRLASPATASPER
ncbi:MAG TPA: GNAT family N-acetyltransferase [Thermoplasmata archaeon]|jgi:ribosomal protein S18 acetylase RimI-like enzyme|nr:GNAT family N-acetyltransferase [Thermoplasmata archaeon]